MADLITHYRKLVGIASGWAMSSLPHWSDDLHRDLLANHGAVAVKGRISSTTMTLPQLSAALDDYEHRGWPRQRQVFHDTVAKKVPAHIGLLVKLWGKLSLAGKVKNSNRKALLAFCTRQVGRNVSDMDSLSIGECQKITEALKSWLGR